MLLMIAGGLIFTEMKTNVLKLFSNIMKMFWNKWELRLMVLFSLSLQILLISLGSKRKYTAKPYIAFLVWATYLFADWMATVSLSTLLKNQGEINRVLVAFWTPFLILHLGGPDTITAYALEDNELWIRHLLGLFIQVGVALFVVYKNFQTDATLILLGLVIPIFFAGIIKYGERIWILRSASSKRFVKFLFSAPAPRPTQNAPPSKPEENTPPPKPKKNTRTPKLPTPQPHLPPQPDPPPTFQPYPFEQEDFNFNFEDEPEDLDFYLTRKQIIPQARYLHEAYLSYQMFVPLFSNLTLRFYKDLEGIFMTLKSKSTEDAFKVVETELEFLYDMLYTKTSILRSPQGAVLRLTCLLFYICAFVAFHHYQKVIIDKYGIGCQKDDIAIFGFHNCQRLDIFISYLLLGGAIFLDIYAAIAYILSKWTMLWLTKYTNRLTNSVYMVIAFLYDLIYRRRKSRSVAQHNLIKFCLQAKATKITRVMMILDTDSSLAKHCHMTWKDVKVDTRDVIYSRILDKYKRYKEKKWTLEFLRELLEERGDHVLKEVYQLDFGESTNEVEFGHSLLVWHIATDLCYYDDDNKYSGTGLLETNGEISKSLSDYMLYLLIMRPGMMRKGINEIRYRDSCAEALKVFQLESNLDSRKASMILLDLPDFRLQIPEYRDKSVLFDGVRLAKNLQSLVTESRWDPEEKWKMISLVWVEMLTYAASHCEWKEHCQQLRRGGELLTHVCLLMAHFGLSLQIRLQDSNHEDHKPSWNWESLEDMAYYLA